jgi:AcrR family transcriptional regulator
MRKPEKMEELLGAAHQVVMRDGIARLTLELVAREAGVSKGAVLYYFPTKNALIAAMMRSWLDAHQSEWDAQLATEPGDAPGRKMRAMLRASACPDEMDERGGASTLAAVANDPELLAIIREHIASWQEDLESDGLDPIRIWTIRLALDGLKFCDMTDMPRPQGELRQQVIEHLIDLATPTEETKITKIK